jgi:hypothetical protein
MLRDTADSLESTVERLRDVAGSAEADRHRRAASAAIAELARVQHQRDLLLATVRSGIVLAPCPTPKQWAEIQAMSVTLLEAVAADSGTAARKESSNG